MVPKLPVVSLEGFAALVGLARAMFGVGSSPPPGVSDGVGGVGIGLLPGDGLGRVIHLRTMHLGLDQLLVGANVSIDSDASLPDVAAIVDAADATIRAAALVVLVEPHLGRGLDPDAPVAAGDVAPPRGTA